MTLELASVPFLVAGAGCLLLVAPVLWASFSRPANRALALFLVVYGTLNLCVGAFFSASTTASQAYWYAVAWYFGLADAVVLLWLVAVYPRPRPRLPGWALGGAPYFLAALAIGVAYAAWRPLAFTYAGPLASTAPGEYYAGVRQGPLLLADHVLDLAFPLAALAFARDALTGRAEGKWRSSLLLAAGLPLLFVFRQASALASLALGRAPLPADPVNAAAAAIDLVQLALLGVVAVTMLRAGRTAERDVADAARRYAALTAAVAALGAGAAVLGAVGFASPASVALTGMTWLAGPAIVAYAVVRHQLAGVDLRVKRTIRHGTLAAFFVGAYAIVSLLAGVTGSGRAAPYLGAAGAILLLLAIVPLQRLADRVASAALPGVHDSAEYRDLRRVEVYRAALEESVRADGSLREGHERTLARLRGSLGITDREHAILLLALRGDAPDVGGDGTLLGRYRVLRTLGSGGQGRTLLAEDVVVRRRVVVKTLRRGAAAADAVVREARALGAVQHSNVVVLHDAERVGDEGFLVMEHVEGGSLAERVAHGPLDADEFARVARGLLAALAAVHANGLVHRDVKPANVLLTRDGEPKLADFGVAHDPDAAETAAVGGDAPGTLAYMSPEQARGHRVTAASDLYSAAATLHEALTGRPLVARRAGETPFDVRARIARGPPAPEHVEPPALRAWFTTALDPDPSRRFADARAMLEALERATARVTR